MVLKRLHGARYSVMPDRIETGTYLVALPYRWPRQGQDTDPTTLEAVLSKVQEAGAEVTTGKDWIELNMHGQAAESRKPAYCAVPCFPDRHAGAVRRPQRGCRGAPAR